jgi:hypothetical protein
MEVKMAKGVIQEYDTKLDNKRRCVIRGAETFDRYHVKVFSNGKIEMTPRVLVNPKELSENTLRMVYSSIRNLKKGKVGSAVDFDKLQQYLKDEE